MSIAERKSQMAKRTCKITVEILNDGEVVRLNRKKVNVEDLPYISLNKKGDIRRLEAIDNVEELSQRRKQLSERVYDNIMEKRWDNTLITELNELETMLEEMLLDAACARPDTKQVARDLDQCKIMRRHRFPRSNGL